MGGRWSSTRGKVLAAIRIGVPSRWVTPGLVDEVLAEAGQAGPGGQRFRALPGRLGVYFVLGLCLFSDLPYREVLRKLASGLGGALAAAGWQVPASTALTGVRRRLGENPFELLFWRLAGPLSPGRAPWSHICGLLAVAWDGTTVAAPASAANVACFGRLRGKKDGHYPLVRLVTLIACGTRALAGAALGPVRGKGSGEQVLARDLLGGLREGMLLLADRNFYGYQLWNAAAVTGADLLWRVKASLHLPVIEPLPDGSWLSCIPDPAAVRRRTARNGKRRRRGSKLGPDTGPVPGITVRAIETGLAEFKTYLRGAGRILRGRTPALARQELWAYLAIYQAIRAVICLAAAGAGIDPDRISFTAALHAIRRTLEPARASPAAALAETEAGILTELIPRREGRVCVRAVARPSSPFPSKRNAKGPISQHAECTVTIRRPDQPPQTTTDQPKDPKNPKTRPP